MPLISHKIMGLKVTASFTWNNSFWNPSRTQTALWLDAADTSSLITSNSLVSQWNDKSGNARHAIATGTERPSYGQASFNNKPGISFDGTANFLACDSLASVFTGNDIPWTAVILLNAAQGVSQTLFSFRSLFYVGHALDLNSAGSASTTRRSSGDANNVALTGTGVVAGGNNIFVLTFYGTSCLISLNGSTYASGPLNASDVTINKFTIGADRSSTGTYSFSRLVASEIIFTQGALSTANRNLFEGYLAYKWGLVANLPSDHPYKTVVPMP